MLSFAIFEHDGPAKEWPINEAHLVGNEELPVQAQLSFADGLVKCEKHSAEPAGIALTYAPFDGEEDRGSLVLQTCLLPERARPYLLSLELARHRIMSFLNKLEDWALSDLPPTDPAMQLFEEARSLFTRALVSQRSGTDEANPGSFSLETDRLARQALAKAIRASEMLVRVEASRNFAGRLSGSLFEEASGAEAASAVSPAKSPTGMGLVLPTKPMVAAGVRAGAFGPAAAKVVQSSSEFLALPMRWVQMEPDEGKYTFTHTDTWIEWAVRTAKLPVVGGPVIDFSVTSVPEWLYIWEHDYETLREVVYEHVRHVVTRYRKTVPRWTIASGLHTNENFAFSFEQMMDLTRMVVLLVRKLQPAAKVQLEVVHPFAGAAGRTPRSMPGALYAEMVAQSGIQVDAWSVRVHLDRPKPGNIGRDLLSLSAALDRYAMLDRPLCVTASGPTHPRADDSELDLWLDEAISVIVSKPSLHAFSWSEQAAVGGPRGGPVPMGPIRPDGSPTTTVAHLAELRRTIREA